MTTEQTTEKIETSDAPQSSPQTTEFHSRPWQGVGDKFVGDF
jgi:hypothetical protein